LLRNVLTCSTFFLESTDTKVPYPVIRYSPPVQRGMVVWLEDVKHRDEAQKLVGSVVWIQHRDVKTPQPESPLQTLSDYLGYRVVLTDEPCGEEARLIDVRQMPGQIMMEIEEQWGTWLCPFQPAFIVSVDQSARIFTLNPPVGLRSLYISEHED